MKETLVPLSIEEFATLILALQELPLNEYKVSERAEIMELLKKLENYVQDVVE